MENKDIIRLYRISEGDPETDLYVYSTYLNEKQIRSFYHYNDQGGMNYTDYERVATQGKIVEIKVLKEVPETDWNIIPFCTDEWDCKPICAFLDTITDRFVENDMGSYVFDDEEDISLVPPYVDTAGHRVDAERLRALVPFEFFDPDSKYHYLRRAANQHKSTLNQTGG